MSETRSEQVKEGGTENVACIYFSKLDAELGGGVYNTNLIKDHNDFRKKELVFRELSQHQELFDQPCKGFGNSKKYLDNIIGRNSKKMDEEILKQLEKYRNMLELALNEDEDEESENDELMPFAENQMEDKKDFLNKFYNFERRGLFANLSGVNKYLVELYSDLKPECFKEAKKKEELFKSPNYSLFKKIVSDFNNEVFPSDFKKIKNKNFYALRITEECTYVINFCPLKNENLAQVNLNILPLNDKSEKQPYMNFENSTPFALPPINSHGDQYPSKIDKEINWDNFYSVFWGYSDNVKPFVGKNSNYQLCPEIQME